NDTPRFIGDRLYLPGDPVKGRLQSESYQMPPPAFNIIGFTCSFELDYFNVLWILERAGIPLSPKERDDRRARGDHVPVIIAGGISISANPFPLLPYFDFIIVYDGEVTLPTFLSEFTRFVDNGGSLLDWWNSYSGKKCCIIPSFLHAHSADVHGILRIDFSECTKSPLDSFPVPAPKEFPDPDLGTRGAAFGTTYMVETGRGCGTGCRFCLVSYHQRPFRFRSLGKIVEVLGALKSRGSQPRKITLLGSNVADHPDLVGICSEILARGYLCSLPSIKIAPDARLIGMIKAFNMKTITIAPETGSERLRRVINKPVSNAEYETLAGLLVENGVSTIKIYLLLGLP
nr:radical SAM protein [Candidatus Sigynarchaeota archaeon]